MPRLEFANVPDTRDRLPQLSAEEQVELAARQMGMEPDPAALGFEDAEAPAMPRRQPAVNFAEAGPRRDEPQNFGQAHARKLGAAAYIAEQARLKREEREAAVAKAEASGHAPCATCWFYDAGDAPSDEATRRFGMRADHGVCRFLPKAEQKKAADWCGQHRTRDEVRLDTARRDHPAVVLMEKFNAGLPSRDDPQGPAGAAGAQPDGVAAAPSDLADVQILSPAEAGDAATTPQSEDTGTEAAAGSGAPPSAARGTRHKALGS